MQLSRETYLTPTTNNSKVKDLRHKTNGPIREIDSSRVKKKQNKDLKQEPSSGT